jgi:hypothetical protein
MALGSIVYGLWSITGLPLLAWAGVLVIVLGLLLLVLGAMAVCVHVAHAVQTKRSVVRWLPPALLAVALLAGNIPLAWQYVQLAKYHRVRVVNNTGEFVNSCALGDGQGGRTWDVGPIGIGSTATTRVTGFEGSLEVTAVGRSGARYRGLAVGYLTHTPLGERHTVTLNKDGTAAPDRR